MIPAITPLPTPPVRTQGSDTFPATADAFMQALADFVPEFNAAIAAIPAEVAPTNFNSTSVSSLTVGTGSKSLTVQASKLYYLGQFVMIASTASPTNYMVGQVTSYNSGTGALVVEVTIASGSGTLSSWTVGPAPTPGTQTRPRVATWGSTTGTATPNFDTHDLFIMTGLTGPVTIAAPTATLALSGDKRMLWIKDNGTTRALTWNAIFRPFGTVALPANTTPNKWIKIGVEYNAIDAKWDVIALAVEP
jgi:hypothetical protein